MCCPWAGCPEEFLAPCGTWEGVYNFKLVSKFGGTSLKLLAFSSSEPKKILWGSNSSFQRSGCPEEACSLATDMGHSRNLGCHISILGGAGDWTQGLAHARQGLLPLSHIPRAISMDFPLLFFFVFQERDINSLYDVSRMYVDPSEINPSMVEHQSHPLDWERVPAPPLVSIAAIAGSILEHLTVTKISLDRWW